MNKSQPHQKRESSTRFIELTSEYRDRHKWPCPAEFTVPITCTNRNFTETSGRNALVGAYPEYTWYQMPYAQPSGEYNGGLGPVVPIIPRRINEVFYSSVWPVRAQVDGNPGPTPTLEPAADFAAATQDICFPESFACVTAQKFNGGSRRAPSLSASLINQNIWSPLTGTTSFNYQYTPQKDYLAGSNLLRFNYDPSVPLNQNQQSLLGWQVLVLTDLAGSLSVTTTPPNNFIEAPAPGGGQQYGSIFALYEKNNSFVAGGTIAVYVYCSNGNGFSVGQTLTNVNPASKLSGSTIAWVYGPNLGANSFVTWPEITSTTGVTLPAAIVESSIIQSYQPSSAVVTIKETFSENFNPNEDFYLIDFNTDPRNDWKDYVTGGPRIFIPGGSDRENAYVGLFVSNYTQEQRTRFNIPQTPDSLPCFSKITRYDSNRRIAYLDNPICLPVLQDSAITPKLTTPIYMFGSSTFVLRRQNPLQIDTISRIGISNGSVLEILIKEKGENFKRGETIASGLFQYLDNTNAIVNYATPDYLLIGPGNGFYGEIEEIMWSDNKTGGQNSGLHGGILKIRVRQQGQGYRTGNYFLEPNLSTAQGRSAVLYIPQVYQCLEIPEITSTTTATRTTVGGKFGDYVFLSSLGQYNLDGTANTNILTRSPAIARYYYAMARVGTNNWWNGLDIQSGEYPLKLTECSDTNPFPETGLRRIMAILSKTETFTGVYATDSAGVVPANFGNTLSVFYIEGTYQNFGAVYQNTSDNLTNMGDPQLLNNNSLPITGNNSILSSLNNSGVLRVQSYQILPFLQNISHSLNYTGSTVSQNQMVCYEIELLSLILPNLPLDNNIGGLIAFYPYIYVELSNVTSPSSGNLGIIYSNNPNSNKALFRVNIDDTSTPVISKFIKLDGDGTVQTIKFKPNDNLRFRVYLYNGELFETDQQDTPPPLPPDFFVQISAEFGIRRLI